jgi:hypothetical protein
LSAATDAGSGALALLTSKATINLIRPKAKPIKIKAQQNNPENYKPTYLIRNLISSESSSHGGFRSPPCFSMSVPFAVFSEMATHAGQKTAQPTLRLRAEH